MYLIPNHQQSFYMRKHLLKDPSREGRVIGSLCPQTHQLGPINFIINSQGFISKQHLGSPMQPCHSQGA